MKTERLLGIIVILLNNQLVTAKELATRFLVSKRTIYRDIVTLEGAGFPIIAIYGNEGGYSLMSEFKLQTLTFTEHEKNWLLQALTLQKQLVTTTNIGQSIEEKLQLLARESPQRTHLTLTNGTIHNPKIEALTKHKIQVIRESTVKQKKLEITYIGANGRQTERQIVPIQLMLKDGSWYLLAFCELRQAERFFKLTRMRKLTQLQESFALKELEGLNPATEEANCQVRCLFAASELGKLYDFFTDDELSKRSTGEYEVTFFSSASQNMLPFLLMFGSRVKVLAPESLIKKHQQAIEELQTIYLEN